ncbi:MAG TPA: hypothetical protein VF169_12810 [Albitalea sp.]
MAANVSADTRGSERASRSVSPIACAMRSITGCGLATPHTSSRST